MLVAIDAKAQPHTRGRRLPVNWFTVELASATCVEIPRSLVKYSMAWHCMAWFIPECLLTQSTDVAVEREEASHCQSTHSNPHESNAYTAWLQPNHAFLRNFHLQFL